MKEKFAFRRRGAGCLMNGGTSVAVPADVTNHWQEVETDVDWMLRGGNAAVVGGSSMWADTMGGECYCGNLLWQSCRTFCVSVSRNCTLPKSCEVCMPKFKSSSRFVMQGFRIFGILASLSGDKEAAENYNP